MAGLDDLDPATPTGASSPTLGDNELRAIKAKVIEFASVEHDGSGEHTFLVGTTAQRPAAGHVGRIYILTDLGVATELQYDNGVSWDSLTFNEDIAGFLADLAIHIASNPATHAAGSIRKGQLDGTVSTASVADVFNGNDATNFHNHDSRYALLGSLGAIPAGYELFTADGTFNVPANVTRLWILAYGGGGGGGGGAYGGGGGGGGGGGAAGCVALFADVVALSAHTVTIGVGGTASSVGGTTSVGDLVFAYGGAGGVDSISSVGGAGGAGGGAAAHGLGGAGNAGVTGSDYDFVAPAAGIGGAGGKTRNAIGGLGGDNSGLYGNGGAGGNASSDGGGGSVGSAGNSGLVLIFW